MAQIYYSDDLAQASLEDGTLAVGNISSTDLFQFANYFVDHSDYKNAPGLARWVLLTLEYRHRGVARDAFNGRLTKAQLDTLQELDRLVGRKYPFTTIIPFVDQAIQLDLDTDKVFHNMLDVKREYNKLTIPTKCINCADLDDFVITVTHEIDSPAQDLTKMIIMGSVLLIDTIVQSCKKHGMSGQLEQLTLDATLGNIGIEFSAGSLQHGEFRANLALDELTAADLTNIANNGLAALLGVHFADARYELRVGDTFTHTPSFSALGKSILKK